MSLIYYYYSLSTFYNILWIYIPVFEHINLTTIKHRNIHTSIPKQTSFKHKSNTVCYILYTQELHQSLFSLNFWLYVLIISIHFFNYLKYPLVYVLYTSIPNIWTFLFFIMIICFLWEFIIFQFTKKHYRFNLLNLYKKKYVKYLNTCLMLNVNFSSCIYIH